MDYNTRINQQMVWKISPLQLHLSCIVDTLKFQLFEVITLVLSMYDLFLNIFAARLRCVFVCERNVEHISAL